MPDIFNIFSADSDSLVLTMLIFLAAATLAFSVMVAVRVRNSVKRRTTRIVDENTRSSKRALRYSSRKAAQSILDYTNKHYSGRHIESARVLRKRLLQAGIFEASAVAKFFVIRAVLAVGIAAAIFFLIPIVRPTGATARSGCWSSPAACSAMSGRACISTSASRSAGKSTAKAFPISWTFWSCARTPVCRSKRRSSGSPGNSATPTRRSPPTFT